jgi:single-strand DNA-binding protein
MVNEATLSVTGYVATQPKVGWTRDGTRTLFMRLGWTPRRMNRTTGEWADQPTSFISVICYRKVAENAAACLRRGDPVLLKGNLRIREFGDENGPKRTAVEVIADSIGHDLSRGITLFKKSTEQLEKTALEREQEMPGGARQPLPGDRDAAARASRELDEEYPSQGEPGAQRDLDSSYPTEPEPDDHELGDSEEFDEEEARQMLAQADDAAEPVGAAT